MREATVEIDDYMYFYSGYGNYCDLDVHRDGGGTWTNLKNWNTYGSVEHASIDLPAGALHQSNVQLRWNRYTSSYPYYYAVLDNVEMMCALDSAAVDDIPVTASEDLSQVVLRGRR